MQINFGKLFFLSNQRQGNTMPQPGEIWQVNYLVQSPLNLNSREQQSLYSSLARSFLAGNSPPRYVMIVKETELSKEIEQQWLIVYVMVLSIETNFISDKDLLIPAEISGLCRDLLAETWHIVPTLACNLLKPVGKRLSRQIYDYLLTVGEYHDRLVYQLPEIPEIQYFGVSNESLYTVNNSEIQNFHQAEQAWSDVLTVPVAAYLCYKKGIKFANAIVNELLQLEQDLRSEISD